MLLPSSLGIAAARPLLFRSGKSSARASSSHSFDARRMCGVFLKRQRRCCCSLLVQSTRRVPVATCSGIHAGGSGRRGVSSQSRDLGSSSAAGAAVTILGRWPRGDAIVKSQGKRPERGELDARHSIRVVALATPSWAGVLDSPWDLIQGELLGDTILRAPGAQIDILAAIVDELPLPQEGENIAAGSAGSEGLTLYVVDESQKGPLPLWTHDPQDTGDDGSATSIGVIDFQIGGIGQQPIEKEQLSYCLRLPLPNTTFVNGRPFTLQVQRWEVQEASTTDITKKSSPTEIILLDTRQLSHCTVFLPGGTNKQTVSSRFRSEQVEALTPFRRVTACMGNILRTLKGSGILEEPIPASEELERSIRENVVTKDSRPAWYEIWAQVVPRELWTEEEGAHEHYSLLPPEHYIEHGHQFHRVLSGGGGWGKKQGLISLDPEPVFGSGNGGFPSETLSMPTDGSPFFRDLVRIGDVLRFICVREDSPFAGWDPLAKYDSRPCVQAKSPSFTFGTASPNLQRQGSDDYGGEEEAAGEEYIPDNGVQRSSTRSRDQVCVIEGQFGALSLQPVSLSVDIHSPLQRPPQNLVRTKLPPRFRLDFEPSAAAHPMSK